MRGKQNEINFESVANKAPLYKQENEMKAKSKIKAYADAQKHAKQSVFTVGDKVLLKWPTTNKFQPRYDPSEYRIKEIKGTMATAKRQDHQITRNFSFFKKILAIKPITSIVVYSADPLAAYRKKMKQKREKEAKEAAVSLQLAKEVSAQNDLNKALITPQLTGNQNNFFEFTSPQAYQATAQQSNEQATTQVASQRVEPIVSEPIQNKNSQPDSSFSGNSVEKQSNRISSTTTGRASTTAIDSKIVVKHRGYHELKNLSCSFNREASSNLQPKQPKCTQTPPKFPPADVNALEPPVDDKKEARVG